MCRRIKSMTADSFNPNWASIASNAVRSSQAISTMREISDSLSGKAPVQRDFFESDTASVVGICLLSGE